jgi:hypothetical protein
MSKSRKVIAGGAVFPGMSCTKRGMLYTSVVFLAKGTETTRAP